MTDEQISQLRAWEGALRRRTFLDEAERLRDAVADPAAADVEKCWEVIWNKPLYANTYVAIAERQERAIASAMPGAWQFIGTDPAKFHITHSGPNNATANFKVAGTLADKLRTEHKIAAHRLYAIQGGAKFLRGLVQASDGAPPFRALATLPLGQLVTDLRTRLGRGWGPITILHMLTDFGLAVKPDLHLVRAAQKLRLLTDLNVGKVPNEKMAIRINEEVAKLADGFFGGVRTPGGLRYVDKLLMEASRQGMLEPSAGENSKRPETV